MKKKIFVSSVLVVMVLSMTLMLLAGCGFKEAKLTKNFAIPEASIGATMATADDMATGELRPIDASMTAYEMLQVGMENFYNSKYAVIEYNGGVKMTLARVLKVNQVVQSTKIRNGQGDAAGDNANHATYFADNKSYSTFAKLYEKFIITPDSYTRKAANDGIKFNSPSKKERLGSWKVGSWKAPETYSSLSELVTANSNNPTILWMYDLQESYINDKIDPIYDAEQKTYKFAFKFDPKLSTVDYLKVMQVQLETNAGMDIKGLEFLQLILEITLWENGTFRSIRVNEAYQMKMMLAGTPIDSAVNLKAMQLFSYNPNEEGYKIQDHIDKF